MFSFIKKDFYIIKANLKTFLVVFLIYGFMCVAGEEFDMTFLLPFLSVMIFISTFSYDELNSWNAYAVTLPDGRRNVVRGKYLASLLFILLTSILAVIFSSGISIYKGSFFLEDIFLSLIISVTAMIIVLSIMYPIVFKFGIEKGKILVLAFIFCGVFLIGGISKIISPDIMKSITTFLDNYYYFVLPLFMIGSIGISYLVSTKIYLKKEF